MFYNLIMSEQQAKIGKFKKVDLEGKTLEEFAKNYLINNNLECSIYNNWIEVFLDHYFDKFFMVNGELFEIIEEKDVDISDYTQINKNGDEIYSFYSTYYDGGTYLVAALEYALKNMV